MQKMFSWFLSKPQEDKKDLLHALSSLNKLFVKKRLIYTAKIRVTARSETRPQLFLQEYQFLPPHRKLRPRQDPTAQKTQQH